MVIFDLDETLLQAFTLRSMERRARELDGGNTSDAADDPSAAADADASKSGWGGGQGGAATTVPGALGADARAATRDAVELERRRGEDRRRLRFDYDLLAQFRDEQCVRMPVPNASGQTQRIAAKMEPVLVTDPDGGEEPVVIHRPTIRVKSPHVRGEFNFFILVWAIRLTSCFVYRRRDGLHADRPEEPGHQHDRPHPARVERLVRVPVRR